MNNKYKAYSLVSIQNLITNSSVIIGFFMNVIVLSIISMLILIFKPDTNPKFFLNLNSDSLAGTKILILLMVFFLFNTVSVMMQDVINDRDSKVSEIINTSIEEKHYIFGKLIAAMAYMMVIFLSFIGAILVVGTIFSIFSSTDFNIFKDVIVVIFKLVKEHSFIQVSLSIIGIVITVVTAVLVTLAMSIKVVKMTEAPSIALIILLPYFILFGLFIVLPVENISQWTSISSVSMYIPFISGLFVLINIAISNVTLANFIALIISGIYVYLIYLGTIKIYNVGFYTREKLSFLQMYKILRKKRT